GGLVFIRPLRAARAAECRRAGCAEGARARLRSGACARRHRGAAGLLACPRTRHLRRVGREGGRAGRTELAHRDAAVAALQEYLLPPPCRGCALLPRCDPDHGALWVELARPENAARTRAAARRNA